MSVVDVIVVGSGPSGVHAAAVCADRGRSVLVLDVGFDDPDTRGAIPAGTFSELRRTDRAQARYLIGDTATVESLSGVRVGAQLTPPRQFITRDVERLQPIESTTFFPLQSLALGGLGAGWGAGTYNYNAHELDAIGLPVADMRRAYGDVAREIGISASADDDIANELADYAPLQAPHPLDTNAAAIFAAYGRARDKVRGAGLAVGRAPGAILSEPFERYGIARDANPYEDMDFYADASRSVYRPRYTLDGLIRSRGVSYRGGSLVERFVATEGAVEVHLLDVASGTREIACCRRLILAAGAIASSRIAMRSLGLVDRPLPILSNAYTYLPCVNLAMLGRRAGDRRHSLAQLCGVYAHDPATQVKTILSFFSYRSLLAYKLVKEMPLPPELGLITARLLLSSLTVVGIHHPDRRTPAKTMTLPGDDRRPLKIDYAVAPDERSAIDATVRGVGRALRAMGVLPFGAIEPGNGSSIHYAGAFAITTDRSDPAGTTASGRFHAAPAVYVADSANWRFLPAKGLTMSLMANARRVAASVCDEMAS